MAGKWGARSCGRDPPSACSAALWRFWWRWVPSAGPPTDIRFLPLPGSVRAPCSCAADDGADGADWSSLSFSSWLCGALGRRSQPCMPRAAETRSACGSLRLPGRVTYDLRPVGALVALGWPVCPYRQQFATPWPVARQRSQDSAPCTGQSPLVEPHPLPSPRREERTPCAAAGCAAPELAGCSAGSAGGQRSSRCALELGRLKGWTVSGMGLDYRKCFDLMPQGFVFEVCTRLGGTLRSWRPCRRCIASLSAPSSSPGALATGGGPPTGFCRGALCRLSSSTP